ncbi:hypothetical protein [Bradyrhizobium sp. SZCCHNR2028]|uniref:hypothetical protein n=1 Tax=Bradyrhizobium sp. SZCCHNR2028 TaxID=3057382 RepID=UPI0028E866F4|nr:hypothetical protein [Bradyrhizobium sp. SZCCHNR2028]
MSEPRNAREFWAATIIDWLIENASLRRERVDLARKFTQEPYNLSVVRVLTMMDELVARHNAASGASLVLSQNWRLAHRSDTVGDFIAAFLQLVIPEGRGATMDDAARDNGVATPGDASESRQGRTQSGRIDALRASPGGDWKPVDFEIIASQYAIKFRKITGTHEVFLHPAVPNCVTIPLKARIRPPHVRAFVAMIDGMEEAAR